MPGKRTEILRVRRGLHYTDQACNIVYAAMVCRRTVTVRFDSSADSLIFEVAVPATKSMIEAAKKGGSDAR